MRIAPRVFVYFYPIGYAPRNLLFPWIYSSNTHHKPFLLFRFPPIKYTRAAYFGYRAFTKVRFRCGTSVKIRLTYAHFPIDFRFATQHAPRTLSFPWIYSSNPHRELFLLLWFPLSNTHTRLILVTALLQKFSLITALPLKFGSPMHISLLVFTSAALTHREPFRSLEFTYQIRTANPFFYFDFPYHTHAA